MVDSSTPLIDDTWLYQWKGRPPEAFICHKTLYRQCTPADIAHNGWSVIKPAVLEMSRIFGVRKPVSKPDTDDKPAVRSAAFEWLSMNNHAHRPCLMGIYRDECVVAAAPLSQKRKPFIPYSLYQALAGDKLLKNVRYKANYRHFFAGFDIGYSFCTLRQNLCCEVSYGLDATVDGRAILWAIMDVEGARIPSPNRAVLTHNLSNLQEKIAEINTDCNQFIRQTGTTWLREYGTDQVIRLIRRLPGTAGTLKYVIDSLRENPQLDRPLTRLDILRLLSQALNFKSDEKIYTLIPLSKHFS